MNHLESLAAEYLNWQGYLVRTNIKVGKLPTGGHAMELDVVGYSPKRNYLVHYETSVDGDSWIERERRFLKKFDNAKKYIIAEIFDWLPSATPIEHIAVCVTHPKARDSVGGGRLLSIDEFVAEVRTKVMAAGKANCNAISESFPLLRMLQLSHNGYNKAI